MEIRTQASAGPFTGPRPFGVEDQDRFFGRDREADILSDFIIAHPVVLLYSAAGAGKSSLLNAQLVPRLQRERQCKVLPCARMNKPIPSGIEYDQIKNIYAFNALLSWDDNNTPLEELAEMTMAQYLKRRIKAANPDGEYEEDRVLWIAVFDQIEDLFTNYPERWEEREGFFNQINDALDSHALRPLLRILVVMREDSLGDMESYSSIFPEQLRIRYRLERLRRDAAIVAVTEPLRIAGRYFEEGAAEELVDNLTETFTVKSASGDFIRKKGRFIDPLQLQLVCQNLWRSLRPGEALITTERVRQSGDVETTLEEFYQNAVLQVESATHIPQRLLRRWFEKELITPDGTRAVAVRGPEKTGGIDNLAVNMFIDMHLIRSELRGNTIWYELAHERFVDVIRDSNKRWLQSREDEQLRSDLEAQAERWMRMKGDPGILLNKAQLDQAESWVESRNAEDSLFSGNVISLIEASRRSRREKSLKRVQYALLALGAIIALMVIVIFYVLQQREAAVSAKNEADKAVSRTQEALTVAEQAKQDAIAATQEAETSRVKEKEQREIADHAASRAEGAAKEAKKQRDLTSKALGKAKVAEGHLKEALGDARETADENSKLTQQAKANQELAEQRTKEAEQERNEKQKQLDQVKELKTTMGKLDDIRWEAIKDLDNPQVYFAYIDDFPKGKHVEEARRKIRDSIPNATGTTATVSGRVLDDQNKAVVGAEVRLTNLGTRQVVPILTSVNGEYTFQELTPGSYIVTANRLGYEEGSIKVEVKQGEKRLLPELFLKKVR